MKASIENVYQFWREERGFIDNVHACASLIDAERVEAAAFEMSFSVDRTNAITLYLICFADHAGMYRYPRAQYASGARSMGWLTRTCWQGDEAKWQKT